MLNLKSRILNLTSGFTLIEMLVVISIIGILASLTLVSYSGAQKQARDSQRRSDLNQYRNALEAFAASNEGNYPSRTSRQDASGALCTTDLAKYLASCLKDPLTYTYYYETDGSDGGVADASRYVLAVQLETGDYWEVCSTGEVGKTGHVASSDNGADCRVDEDL